ncbi:DUF6647 family protein [Tropicimonas isoalkanivorans]|uniref:DUF6647 domain-containing protein n=1 Tax=Tropicimonas isoalkanivorans TaxID=441112 RepID=A0A1I1DEW0_9RHOB|nr:DUF6647 family protein [Tropicimonas isoalkanivorans]SFB73377.1 hypothetical protein SAMN04488094_101185 [Tropicimonas isoalkanivorans]
MQGLMVAGLTASLAHLAAADECAIQNAGPPAIDVSEIADLWAWVTDELGITESGPAPPVCAVSREELELRRLGNDLHGRPALEIEALYDRKRRQILVPETWSGNDPASLSVIVHELVHHAHTVSNRTLTCAEDGEKEAYAVQATWLERRDLDLHVAFGLDALTLKVLTSCSHLWY